MYLLQIDGQKTNPGFLETRSIWYPYTDFADWLNIINCSGKPGNPVITGIQIALATYLDTEQYANQLGTLIQLLDNSVVINLEEYDWFKKKSIEGNTGYDTGTPCPPATGCPQ